MTTRIPSLAFSAVMLLLAVGCGAAQPTPTITPTPSPTPTATALPTATPYVRHVGPRTIYLVRPDGTGLKKLALGRDPHFSSDGRYLSFIQQNGDTDALVLYDRASGETHPISLDGTETEYGWSPDARLIAAIVRRAAGSDVALVDPVDGSIRTVASASNLTSLLWSPNSHYVAWVKANPDPPRAYPPYPTPDAPVEPQLAAYAVGSGKIVTLVEQPGAICSPDWSPDSAQIAYAAGRQTWCFLDQTAIMKEAPQQQVYRVRVPQGNITQITHLTSLAYYVRWSPKTHDLAYLDINSQMETTVHIIDIHASIDSHTENIGRNYWNGITWSPDGRKLVLAGGTGAWIYDTTTFSRQVFVGGPAGFWPDEWSPDGNKLLIGWNCCGLPGFLEVDVRVPGKSITPYSTLIKDKTYSTGRPVWSPEGDWIAFWAFEGCDGCG